MGKKDQRIEEAVARIRILKDAKMDWQRGWGNACIREVLQQEVSKAQDELFEVLDQDSPKAEAPQQRKEPQTPRNSKPGVQ